MNEYKYNHRCINHPDFFPDECGCLSAGAEKVPVAQNTNTHIEEVEEFVENISKRMAKGDDDERRIGTGTFISILDREIIKEVIQQRDAAHEAKLKEAVEAEREKYQKHNIGLLVAEMVKDIQEHGDMHGKDCPCNMEDPDECNCTEMKFWGSVIQEWMGKVNQMWVSHLMGHRKHCTPEGNKDLTRIKKALTPPTDLTK